MNKQDKNNIFKLIKQYVSSTKNQIDFMEKQEVCDLYEDDEYANYYSQLIDDYEIYRSLLGKLRKWNYDDKNKTKRGN